MVVSDVDKAEGGRKSMRKRQSLSQIKLSDAQKEKLKDEMKAF